MRDAFESMLNVALCARGLTGCRWKVRRQNPRSMKLMIERGDKGFIYIIGEREFQDIPGLANQIAAKAIASLRMICRRCGQDHPPEESCQTSDRQLAEDLEREMRSDSRQTRTRQLAAAPVGQLADYVKYLEREMLALGSSQFASTYESPTSAEKPTPAKKPNPPETSSSRFKNLDLD